MKAVYTVKKTKGPVLVQYIGSKVSWKKKYDGFKRRKKCSSQMFSITALGKTFEG
jgi:hypothetical protein